jgi:HlyD family secretion protein
MKHLFPLLIAGIFLTTAGCASKAAGTAKGYEFTNVTRGTLEKTVSSTGSLKPVATVNVLARMSGKVERIYVDYNDTVHKGDVLAELNTDMLRLQREQQMAAVIKARANYELQQVNYYNLEKLAEKNLISEYELKSGKTTLDIQSAELASAEASLRVIDTELNQYALITSPIDGIVLERNISVGSTVVEGSNSNSTSLFTLAENPDEMQIEAGVGELDVSNIRRGQAVRFTLEALPGRTYSGVVENRYLMPTVQDSVVSYTVIINVENRDGSLLPGMTCAVDFIEEQKENALILPNAALRYQPANLTAAEIADRLFEAGLAGMDEAEQAAAREARAKTQAAGGQTTSGTSQGGLTNLMAGGNTGMRGGGFGGPPPGAPGEGGTTRTSGGTRPAGGAPVTVTRKALWYINDEGKLDVMMVRTGISDGSYTEILDPPAEGMRIILREKV